MGAGAGFRMALKTESGAVNTFYTLQGAVEQGAVSGPQAVRQRGFIHRETVVLTADHDLSAIQIQDRMVAAVMAELHLYAAGAAG